MADYRKRLSDMTDEERAEVAPGSAAYGNFLGKAESGKPLSVQMAEVGVEFTPVGTVSGVLDIKEELESEDPDYTDVEELYRAQGEIRVLRSLLLLREHVNG